MDQPLPSSETVDLARVARLVRPFETLEPHAVRRPGGGWSIGYGHVRSARAGAEVTAEEAEALLRYDLRHVASVVQSAIYAPIHRNQLEALIAFAFHIGTESFLHSTTLHRFNAGDSLGAAQEIERWCRADFGGEAQVVDALVRRRAAEKAHFLTPPQGFPKASRARLQPQFEASAQALGEEGAQAAPSAALAAAHSVSARLRALVPDVADQAEPRPSIFEPAAALAPEPAADHALAETVAEPRAAEPEPVLAAPVAAAAVAAPILFEAFAPSEPEIPPPPMPFEVARSAAFQPAAPESAAATAANAATPDRVTYDVWPSFAPAQIRADDPFAQGPFAQGPLDAAAIEAPPLDQSAPISSLFRAKPEHRVQIPPRPEQTGTARSPRAPFWASVPRLWLWACVALGVAVFVWSIWSIFNTSPNVVNFLAGLVGVAVMAVPAYLLLGANAQR